MTNFLIVLCFLTVFCKIDLFEPLGRNVTSNAADCTKLTAEQCPLVAACMLNAENPQTCVADPCNEILLVSSALDTCSKTPAPGTTCVEIPGKKVCITSGREVLNHCSAVWGETSLIVESECYLTLAGCETSTAIPISDGTTYYVCNPKPTVTDFCSKLTEEICPYIGKCMWEGGSCVADPCWEKLYTSSDGCNNATATKYTITTSPVFLGYCKTPGHDMHSKCNGGTGSNVITKLGACSGYPAECNKIVTINNYNGGKLYVCDEIEAELTVPDAAVSLNSFAIALLSLVLLIAML